MHSSEEIVAPGQGVELTTEAILAVKRHQQENTEWDNLPLRVYIAGKICSGFTYGVTFDAKADEDLQFKSEKWGGFSVVMDQDTLEYVNGSIVDWVDDERGTGFLVENPRQKKYKGKFFNRKKKPE